ncbi:RNA 3'-phosphate cyclase [Candidatus Micrarchaeota archaeon]|nr:RNA 3'-phosphate cyclase [Candidatus Micrarchaeota archaeon]
MLFVDGSHLEGGGQILRTSLSLSVLLRQPFEIKNIRANRPNPGMRPQHLAAVRALQQIANARITDAYQHSSSLRFEPRELNPGKFIFDVASETPSAGSVTLLFQALLPALAFAPQPSALILRGGTHVSWSPSYEYLQSVFLPALKKFGLECHLSIKKCGFYPEGGGEMHASITPVSSLQSFSLLDRGPLQSITGVSGVGHLTEDIATRQKSAALNKLVHLSADKRVSQNTVPSRGKGSFLFLNAHYAHTKEGFGSLGGRGKTAERVGSEAADALMKYHASNNALDIHLADQLLLYAALAEGGSRFSCEAFSNHLRTNVYVLQRFLPKLEVELDESRKEVRVRGIGFHSK